MKPVISDAMTSGVNCARLNESPAAFATDAASVVLPTPGTSSIRICPPEIIAARIRAVSRRFPVMTFPTSLRIESEIP